MKRYLSVKEVCKQLGVGKSLIYSLIQNGQIPATRLGERILVDEEGLQILLDSNDMVTRAATAHAQSEPPPPPAAKAKKKATKKKDRIDLW